MQDMTMAAALAKYFGPSLEVVQALEPGWDGLAWMLFSDAVTDVAAQCQKSLFLSVETSPKVDDKYLFHAGLLWNPVCKGELHTPQSGTEKLTTWTATGKKPWRLATAQELVSFAWNSACPWRSGSNGRLVSQSSYVVASGNLDLDYSDTSFRGSGGRLLGVTDSFQGDMTALVIHAYLNNWSIVVSGDATNTNLLQPLKSISVANLIEYFDHDDTNRANLPPLDSADFTDPKKGLWEWWGLDSKALDAIGLRARNPADDVQEGVVAIDFGTSSTVVAIEQNGVGQLLRIGVTDFWETPKPSHYENPTVLEFVDLEAMFETWRSEAYRPYVEWDEVRCSHEALHNFRNNDTKPEVVASVLTKIKQWALREGGGTRVRLTDRQGIEHELAPLTLRQPVKGRALEVSESDPFDPVELYAWFLGLTINWRRRGIFLRYFMTFPVDYPREVKDKILASFRRGLQRSLPATLVTQPVFEQFTVEDRVSEPAAYAAIALQTLAIDPTTEGVAYGVFDFGGGTTDFDFGYYRLPTDTEERSGVEQVFEHFGNGGDKFLGGENLLDHLAYLTFRHNIEVCRSKKIAFTKPLDALDFNGSEMFLERTQAAATNTLMLVSRLRRFWESGEETNKTGVEKIELLDRYGKKHSCEFNVPYPELKALLEVRIEEGVHNFFTALKKAFGEELPLQMHVLLAGNASRSAIVHGLFGLLSEDHPQSALLERTRVFWSILFAGKTPEFIVHAPLEADEGNVNRPTGKTGVALGLLQLCPGSATRVVNHAVQNAKGDAPFQHYVGRIKLKKFHVSLSQGGAYHKWVELGPVSEDRVFNLFHSQAARAHTGEMALGDPAMTLKRQHFAGDVITHQTFSRPIKPHEIEVCTAASLEAVERGEYENLRVLKLV